LELELEHEMVFVSEYEWECVLEVLMALVMEQM
jgi:hypothetical protein